MGERLKPAVLKTVIPLTRDRGFESSSLRQPFNLARGTVTRFSGDVNTAPRTALDGCASGHVRRVATGATGGALDSTTKGGLR